jgi:hypothetical protein
MRPRRDPGAKAGNGPSKPITRWATRASSCYITGFSLHLVG